MVEDARSPSRRQVRYGNYEHRWKRGASANACRRRWRRSPTKSEMALVGNPDSVDLHVVLHDSGIAVTTARNGSYGDHFSPFLVVVALAFVAALVLVSFWPR